ncbi:MAG: hypothetical protein CMA72_00835 [Euryarchaeota archaeon]|nr:hypothetical protein [Euryarchaeota archaeon]
MYSILFSFLKPQIAFGGDSGGGGGSSSGGGGGSRADKKGAAAVLSAPKPVYTPPPPPVVNTSRDRSDRKGAAAVMSAPKPAPVVVSPATRAAEEDNRSIFDQLENIQLVSKDRPELQFAGGDGPEPSELRAPSRPVVPSNLTFGTEPTAVSAVSPLSFDSGTTTKAAGSAPVKKTGITSGLDPNAKVDLYKFADQFDTSKDMPGSPRNLQDEVDFQERMMRQNIAAAIDPYGQTTATDSNLTSRAVDMLNKGNMSKEQYEQAVKDLGVRLDQPRFGDSGLGKMFEASPLGQGLDYLGDMNQRRAYEKLTGQYEPGFLASVFTNYGDGERQVPVFDNGQVIGALGVDAAGNIINYTGEHSDTAQVFDETIDAEKAKDYTRVYEMGDPSRLDGSDNNDRGRGEAEDGEEGGAEEPTCPDGYIFDSEENACVLDPFQDPFPDAPTTGGGTYTAPALSPYTSVAPVTLPSLMPGQQPAFVVPTPTAQPITVAAQTPAGLASLRRS